ncbi:MAG TPA: hypothetical protein VFN35_21245 [Ktedonobacteraceae bacterium]|nr:hypothetical protein [Ktedonobacteraceae bacterium]
MRIWQSCASGIGEEMDGGSSFGPTGAAYRGATTSQVTTSSEERFRERKHCPEMTKTTREGSQVTSMIPSRASALEVA